jgi:hypothetical protein
VVLNIDLSQVVDVRYMPFVDLFSSLFCLSLRLPAFLVTIQRRYPWLLLAV